MPEEKLVFFFSEYQLRTDVDFFTEMKSFCIFYDVGTQNLLKKVINQLRR
jgi:hypothetical protein